MSVLDLKSVAPFRIHAMTQLRASSDAASFASQASTADDSDATECTSRRFSALSFVRRARRIEAAGRIQSDSDV